MPWSTGAFGALGEVGLLGSLAAALALRLMRHRARSQGNGRLNTELSRSKSLFQKLTCLES